LSIDETESISKRASHRTFPLEDFKTNGDSNLNCYTKSRWDHECSSAKTSMVQGNSIWFVPWDNINSQTIEYNNSLPSVNSSTTTLIPFTIESLFDDYDGISKFWYPKTMLPNEISNANTFTMAIIQSDSIMGILVVEINHLPITANNYLRNITYVECIVQQRAAGSVQMNVSNVETDAIGFLSYISKNNNNNILIDIGSNKCSYIENEMHTIEFFSFELDSKLQYDNSCKNECNGHGSSSCSYPCVDCMIKNNDICKFPTPTTMFPPTRTYDSMV
jgi:hypothetical protein